MPFIFGKIATPPESVSMENTQQLANPEAEISLLDLLVTLADNVKLLILGPLAAGLTALGVAFVLPQTFESVAILQAEPATASLMSTASVLDPTVASLGLNQGQSVESSRQALRTRIKTAMGRTDKLLTVTVSGTTPQQAQATANALLAATYVRSRPTGITKERLDTQLVDAKTRLEGARVAGDKVLSIFESAYVADSQPKTGAADLPKNYTELLNTISAAQAQALQIEAQLDGLTDSQLVQAPTLPEKAVSPKKGLIAIGVTLATGFMLLLFVFIRNGLRRAEADPASAAKLVRIRRALSLRSPSKA
jgi:LPS O-antigen subunit length determinant protein (WzzB/FepE family)